METFIITQLSVSEMRQIIQEELAQFFAQDDVSFAQATPSKLVGIDQLIEACPFIGAKGTVYKKVSNREIPHFKKGKRLFFDLDQIDQWLREGKVTTMKDIEEEADEYMKRNSLRWKK